MELINNRKSPIKDEYIGKYLAQKELDLTATPDAQLAFSNADFVVIETPTNYDSQKIFFRHICGRDCNQASYGV